MKLGLVSAILDTLNYEDMILELEKLGLHCAEVACWPQGSAERRYAGVSHIDVARGLTDQAYAQHILDFAAEHHVEISALAFYPNTLDGNLEKRQAVIAHLKTVIKAAAVLKVNMVATFIGRVQNLTFEDNLKEVEKVWPDILQLAESLKVKIAIENCPMLFGPDQWPGGQNLMTTPAAWRKIFALLKSDYLGINFDPSHFIWQQIDYLKPVYEFKDKIFHVHFKDIKLFPDKLADVGVMAYPLDFMSPKIPGLGDVNWGKFVSALTDIGYDGYACIEIEDKSFEGSFEKVQESIILAKRNINLFVV